MPRYPEHEQSMYITKILNQTHRILSEFNTFLAFQVHCHTAGLWHATPSSLSVLRHALHETPSCLLFNPLTFDHLIL